MCNDAGPRPGDEAVSAWLLGPTCDRFLVVGPPRRDGVMLCSAKEVQEKNLE